MSKIDIVIHLRSTTSNVEMIGYLWNEPRDLSWEQGVELHDQIQKNIFVQSWLVIFTRNEKSILDLRKANKCSAQEVTISQKVMNDSIVTFQVVEYKD